MNPENHQASQEASSEAVTKAMEAAEAREKARAAQLEEQNRNQTHLLIDALKSVFGDGDEQDPQQMRILVRRIPILCTNIDAMHKSIEKIEGNIEWVVKIILGAFILGLVAVLWK